MICFCRLYKKESTPDLYLESCGIADLFASASGGRNYNGAKKMAETNKSIKDIEKEELNGQSLQGPGTAKEAYNFLQSKNVLDDFPLFRDAYLICEQKIEPKKFLENLSKHPEFNDKQPKQ
jgi:glycerol-3-phosphate dehydrogenase (NAD+)